MSLEVVGVCPKNFGSGLPYGIASVASKTCERNEQAGRGRPI